MPHNQMTDNPGKASRPFLLWVKLSEAAPSDDWQSWQSICFLLWVKFSEAAQSDDWQSWQGVPSFSNYEKIYRGSTIRDDGQSGQGIPSFLSMSKILRGSIIRWLTVWVRCPGPYLTFTTGQTGGRWSRLFCKDERQPERKRERQREGDRVWKIQR